MTRRSDRAIWHSELVREALTWALLVFGLLFVLVFAGCYTPDERADLDTARRRAAAERVEVAEKRARGEITPAQAWQEFQEIDARETGSRQSVEASSTTRWLGDLTDPTSLARDLVLCGLTAVGLNSHRNRTRRKALADAKGGAP